MTGNTYSRDDITDHIGQVAQAQGWPAEELGIVLDKLLELPGWAGVGGLSWDLDGQPNEAWYVAAAAYLRTRTDLDGADKLADLYDVRPAMDAAQADRDWDATVGVVTGTAQGSLEDVAAASSGVANTIEAAAKSSKTPWLIGLGLVVAGLVAWRSR